MLFAAASFATGALFGPSVPPLEEARRRAVSPARKEFEVSLLNGADELTLAVLIGAEERHSDDTPSAVVQEVFTAIDELASKVERRISFENALGGIEAASMLRSLEMERQCLAVSTTLFGAAGAPDDSEAAAGEKPFFSGNADNYYDPANSFVDQVLSRRAGIPISLSLVYKACAERVGTTLVGLNAPSHLLLAPEADPSLFAIDPFEGTLMNADALKTFVQARLPPQLPAEAVDDFISSRLLAQPMTRFDWIARSLRNLRYVYANANDDVRLLGAAERLLLLANAQAESSNAGSTAAAVAPGGGSSGGGTSSSGRGGSGSRRSGGSSSDGKPRDDARAEPTVTPQEVRQCEREIAICLCRLEDMDRREEAREYLTRSISGSTASDAALPEQAKAQIRELLETEPYFAAS